MPNASAASASPAMSPPPTSEVVLMSGGSATFSCFRLAKLLVRLATTPPAANHVDVGRLTKPPNDDAYGDGSTTASRRKSAANPVRLAAANFLYAARDLMILRSISVANPIPTPTQMAVRW